MAANQADSVASHMLVDVMQRTLQEHITALHSYVRRLPDFDAIQSRLLEALSDALADDEFQTWLASSVLRECAAEVGSLLSTPEVRAQCAQRL